MSTINIDKREVPVTARNKRVYPTTGVSTSSTTTGSGGGGITSDVTKEYVDGSLATRDVSINWLKNNTWKTSTLLLKEPSLNMAKFKWAGGLLEPSIAIGIVSVTAGSGIVQDGTATNPELYIASMAGVAGSIGTINVDADSIGVMLGTTSTVAAAGNHNHAGYLTAEVDTLNSVTSRGFATTNPIQTGNISIKDQLTFTSNTTNPSNNVINSYFPLKINYAGTTEMLITDTSIVAYNDITINKTYATLILKSDTQTTEQILFKDNSGTELEIGHDGLNLDETYINAHKPFRIKYDGVDKFSVTSAGASSPTLEASLGVPSVSGYVLSSTTSGVRSWVANGSGGSGSVTSVTAGNGMTQSGTATINPTLDIVSHAGTAGSIGTINIGADRIGVNLGTTSTTAAAGNHTHATLYAPITGSANYIQNQNASAQASSKFWVDGSIKVNAGIFANGTNVNTGTTSIHLYNNNVGGEKWQVTSGINNVSEPGFSIRNASTGGIPFVIAANGYMGMNKVDPVANLDIRDNGKTNVTHTLSLGSTDTPSPMRLVFSRNTNQNYELQSVEDGVAYRDLLLNPAGGNVAIGRQADTYQRLAIKGSTSAAGNYGLYIVNSGDAFVASIANNGDMNVAGWVTANRFVATATGATSPFIISSTTVNTNLNADMLDGLHLASTPGAGGPSWNAIPFIRSDGVLEVGKYIDFHETSGSTTDYDVRLQSITNGDLLLNGNKIYHAGNLTPAPARNVANLSSPVTSGSSSDTLLHKILIPANSVSVGSTYRFKMIVTNNSASTLSFSVRVGANGTTSDTVAWQSIASGTMSTLGRAGIDGLLTVRSATSVYVDSHAYWQGSAGGGVLQTVLAAPATTTIASTSPWYIDLCCYPMGNTVTCQLASIEEVK